MSLTKYEKKRNFKNTPEPKGNVKKTKTKKLSYVIQYHKARTTHYDFRLEYNGVLLSWAVPKGLSTNPKTKRLAVMVEDHPLDYKNFSGIIPKGNYGAGTVEIFDKGTYTPLDNFKDGLKKGHLKFALCGEVYNGIWSLIKTENNNWIILKQKDEFADLQASKKIANKNAFKICDVQLATLVNEVPKGKNWLFEIKYDGYRIITYIENNKVKMLSRNGTNYTTKFDNLKKSLQSLCKDCPMVLDGEVVMFDKNGKTDFGLLQQNIKQKNNNFSYIIFDLLSFMGKDLRNLPLLERKEKLKQLLVNSPKNLIYGDYVIGKGQQCFNFAKKQNLEGIVAKQIKSTYNGKRDNTWLKIKCYKRQEFVIGGYTTTQKNKQLSAILVGYYKSKKLIYAGKVGTGFSINLKKELSNKFKKLITEKNRFNSSNTPKNAIWLMPSLVAEIQFAELTKENILRQPSFIGLRTDKKPKQVVLESENER